MGVAIINSEVEECATTQENDGCIGRGKEGQEVEGV